MIPLFLLLGACTFEPGTGFARLDSVSLEARLVPGAARALENGAILTDLAYEVHLDRLDLDVEQARLEELSGGAGDSSFDPADPPEGYSLCHGGHCHASDGSLVSYSAIEAELAGGGASWSAVATLAFGASVDLLQGLSVEFGPAEPSPELPLCEIRRLALEITGLHLEGEVTGGALHEDVVSLRGDLMGELSVESDLELVVDRDLDPFIELRVALEPDGTLLDGLEFATLAQDGVVQVSSVDESGAAILAALGATLPVLSLTSHP